MNHKIDTTITMFDDLRKRYVTSSAEQKLIILRRQLLRPFIPVESSAHLLQTAGDQIYNYPPDEISAEEFKNTVIWLAEAARDPHQILDALTLDVSKVQ